MFVGRVIDDEIDNDANAALSGSVGEFNEITVRAIGWVDAVII
jgi:hypothetical protein